MSEKIVGLGVMAVHIKNGSKSYCGLSNSTYQQETTDDPATCKRCLRAKASWDRVAEKHRNSLNKSQD